MIKLDAGLLVEIFDLKTFVLSNYASIKVNNGECYLIYNKLSVKDQAILKSRYAAYLF